MISWYPKLVCFQPLIPKNHHIIKVAKDFQDHQVQTQARAHRPHPQVPHLVGTNKNEDPVQGLKKGTLFNWILETVVVLEL